MNRITLVLALGLLMVCSPACAQKGSPATQVVSKVQAKEAEKQPEKSVVKTEEKVDLQAASDDAPSGRPTKSTGRMSITPEQDKKIKSLAKQTVKGFAKAELTDQQQAQAEELFTKAVKDFVVKRSKAEITDELEKKRAAGLKEARAAGKSVKEQADAALVIAGYSDDQIKVHKATQAALIKAKREFGKQLSEEQVAKLPKQLQGIILGK